ncbi:DUF3817 domain-containing protein [Salana multivorans]
MTSAPHEATHQPASAVELPASQAEETRAAFGRYKVMAWVTGAFLLLLCVEMVLKYVVQVNGPDQAVLGSWIAIVHGWIYVIYAVTCLQIWSKARWGFGRLVVMILGGIVPVLSFVVEARAARWPLVRRGAQRQR